MKEKIAGLPLLLVAAMLIGGSGLTLLVREDFATEELVGAVLLMSAGLVTFGAWLALEIIGWRQRNLEHQDNGAA